VRDNLQDYYKALQDLDRAIEIDPFDPDLLVSRGTVKIHMGSYTWSLIDLDSAISLDHRKVLAYMNRAVARASLKDYDGAISDCNQAVRLDRYNEGAYLRRGVVHSEMGEYDLAEEDFDYAIRLNPENPYTYFSRALARFNTQDTLGALQDYSEVLRLDPYNALSLYNRALLKSQMHDLYGALEDYNKVLLINPDNIYTFYNRAVILHIMEDYRGAIADYSRAIELFPDFAGAYLNRSEAKRSLRDEKGAYLDYQKAMQIMEEIHVNGYDSLTVKQFADSAYFNKIIEFEADFVKVNMQDSVANRSVDPELSFMVQVLVDPMLVIKKTPSVYDLPELKSLKNRQFKDMILILTNLEVDLSLEDAFFKLMEIDSLLDSNPTSAEAYFMKGIINAMVQNYNTALQELDRSLQLQPDQPLVYLNKGFILFEMAENSASDKNRSNPVTITWEKTDITSQPKEPQISPDYYKALEAYDKLLKMAPDFAFGYFNRAIVKVRLKDYSGAIADYSKAIEKQPGLAEAYFNRALTLIYLNDTGSACQDLSRAGELGLQQAYKVIQQYCKKQ
jgi:tetratricopeptide (TPR) repeat protein